MANLLVHPCVEPLVGSVPAPPDARTLTVALTLAALAPATTRSALQARGRPELAMIAALTSLGVQIAADAEGIEVIGVGLDGLQAASGPIDAGSSPVTMAALAGVLAGQRFASRLVGDEAVMRRAMAAIAQPIRQRGGQIEGRLQADRVGELGPPIDLQPPSGGVLSELSFDLPPGSLPAKTSALMSGLFADGPTTLRESLVSDGCERLLEHAGALVEGSGPFVKLAPLGVTQLRALQGEVAGDAAAAGAVMAAALSVPGSRVGIRGVPSSRTRCAIDDVLRDAGAAVTLQARPQRLGEPVSDVTVQRGELRGLRVAGELALRVGVPLPTMAAMAAAASPGQQSELSDVMPRFAREAELSEAMLRAFDIDASCSERGISLRAPTSPLSACEVDAHGDGAIAMAATALALRASGACLIRHADGIMESFPRFVGSLRALGAHIEVTE